jgi:hypothetical protein
MQVRLIAAVAVWALLGQGAMAQSGPDGPAELPPESFTDAQYVDSTGCVFLRAGLNDQVMWVPRVTKDRKPLCGYAPSLAATPPVVEQAVDVVAPQASPGPVAVESQPAETAPKTARRRAATAREPAPLRCAAEAPLLARVPLLSGGMAVICLSDDARIVPQSAVLRFEDAVPLAPGVGQVLVCPRGATVAQRLPMMSGGATLLCTAGTGSLAKLSVPKLRGGAKPAPTAEGSFVQVASFVQPANAARTKAWLARLGLPVATGQVTLRGQAFEVIFAGPFFQGDTADATLALVRAAGFDDAFLR